MQPEPTLAAHGGGTLTVSVTGPGTVTSDPSGIDCGSDCSESYPSACAFDPEIGAVVCDHTTVELTATPVAGWAFVGWGGACTGTGACSVTMSHGNVAVSASFADTTPPTVTLMTPADGATVGSAMLARAGAGDMPSGVSRVDFFVGGVLRSTDTAAPYEASISMTAYAHGTAHLVKARATDLGGNETTTAEVSVTVDRLGPTVDLASTGPAGGATVSSTSATFEFTSADLDLAGFQCRLDSGASSGAFGSCTSPKTYTELAPAQHTFRVRATDAVGNVGPEFTRTWTVHHPFTDITGNQFETEITWLYFQAITLGCNQAGTLFCPTLSVTREQMASFLVRALDLPAATEGDHFVDDEGSVHENDINALFEAGITTGCGTGTVPGSPTLGQPVYCPSFDVTREQMASFIARGLAFAGTPLPEPSADYFDDDESSVFHQNDINKMAEAGITLGCGVRLYCPSQPVTREQMAAFLYRALAE